MRKMDKVGVSKSVQKAVRNQYSDRLAEKVQFGDLVAVKTLRDAAVIHMRHIALDNSLRERVWYKALGLRDRIIDDLDPEWPHYEFWREFENLWA